MTIPVLRTYDPSQVIVTIGGVIATGFSDGDPIMSRRSEDSYSKRVGIDGDVARARNANKTGEFEFKFLQTSPTNDLLSGLFATDDLTNEGTAVVPITIIDGSGRSLATASQCWLQTLPEMSMGKDAGERVWVFCAADLRVYYGGN